MAVGRFLGAITFFVAMFALAIASPASAQFSDSYNFLKAVRDSDGDKVNDFLRGNKSTLINTRDYSTGEGAVHIVVKRRDALWLRFMLANGANPNMRDNNGNTALILAAQISFADAVAPLVQAGANPNLTNNSGETPLIAAVQQHDIASVRLLLAAGADPKIADHIAGMSARDYAARDSRSTMILKLLDDAASTTSATPKKPVQGPGL